LHNDDSLEKKYCKDVPLTSNSLSTTKILVLGMFYSFIFTQHFVYYGFSQAKKGKEGGRSISFLSDAVCSL
jgi:hypothetical protein